MASGRGQGESLINHLPESPKEPKTPSRPGLNPNKPLLEKSPEAEAVPLLASSTGRAVAWPQLMEDLDMEMKVCSTASG